MNGQANEILHLRNDLRLKAAEIDRLKNLMTLLEKTKRDYYMQLAKLTSQLQTLNVRNDYEGKGVLERPDIAAGSNQKFHSMNDEDDNKSQFSHVLDSDVVSQNGSEYYLYIWRRLTCTNSLAFFL